MNLVQKQKDKFLKNFLEVETEQRDTKLWVHRERVNKLRLNFTGHECPVHRPGSVAICLVTFSDDQSKISPGDVSEECLGKPSE